MAKALAGCVQGALAGMVPDLRSCRATTVEVTVTKPQGVLAESVTIVVSALPLRGAKGATQGASRNCQAGGWLVALSGMAVIFVAACSTASGCCCTGAVSGGSGSYFRSAGDSESQGEEGAAVAAQVACAAPSGACAALLCAYDLMVGPGLGWCS